MTGRIQRIEACLNGRRSKNDHPAVPVTPAELAAKAAEAAHFVALGAAVPLLLHGEDETCWPPIRHAGRLGLATRIGLEDVTAGPDGQPVKGNGELTALALTLWAAAAVPRRTA